MTLEFEVEKVVSRLNELYAENLDISEDKQIIKLKEAIDSLNEVIKWEQD